MSYGRQPYYIYSDGEFVHFIGTGSPDVKVPVAAMAQFIASMITRGDEEVQSWIQLGKEIRTDIPKDLEVKVTGDGWGKSNS